MSKVFCRMHWDWCPWSSRCCEELRTLLTEFADFKRSKHLHDHIVNINTLEEEADELFISSMRTLHTTTSDPIQIIVWREIYIYLGKMRGCLRTCRRYCRKRYHEKFLKQVKILPALHWGAGIFLS